MKSKKSTKKPLSVELSVESIEEHCRFAISYTTFGELYSEDFLTNPSSLGTEIEKSFTKLFKKKSEKWTADQWDDVSFDQMFDEAFNAVKVSVPTIVAMNYNGNTVHYHTGFNDEWFESSRSSKDYSTLPSFALAGLNSIAEYCEQTKTITPLVKAYISYRRETSNQTNLDDVDITPRFSQLFFKLAQSVPADLDDSLKLFKDVPLDTRRQKSGLNQFLLQAGIQYRKELLKTMVKDLDRHDVVLLLKSLNQTDDKIFIKQKKFLFDIVLRSANSLSSALAASTEILDQYTVLIKRFLEPYDQTLSEKFVLSYGKNINNSTFLSNPGSLLKICDILDNQTANKLIGLVCNQLKESDYQLFNLLTFIFKQDPSKGPLYQKIESDVLFSLAKNILKDGPPQKELTVINTMISKGLIVMNNELMQLYFDGQEKNNPEMFQQMRSLIQRRVLEASTSINDIENNESAKTVKRKI